MEQRLIDANALKILPDRFKNYYRVGGARGDGKSFQTMALGILVKVQEAIDNAPTIDAVPVVHGRWCYTQCDMRPRLGSWYCSACERSIPAERVAFSKYCPNCGAKMDGGSE